MALRETGARGSGLSFDLCCLTSDVSPNISDSVRFFGTESNLALTPSQSCGHSVGGKGWFRYSRDYYLRTACRAVPGLTPTTACHLPGAGAHLLGIQSQAHKHPVPWLGWVPWDMSRPVRSQTPQSRCQPGVSGVGTSGQGGVRVPAICLWA